MSSLTHDWLERAAHYRTAGATMTAPEVRALYESIALSCGRIAASEMLQQAIAKGDDFVDAKHRPIFDKAKTTIDKQKSVLVGLIAKAHAILRRR